MSKNKSYPIRIPRFASGIRAQESKSTLNQCWWAHRWMDRLNHLDLGVRLGKARNYAMSGQVIKLEIKGPTITASVVGVRPDPYQVTVNFRCPKQDAHKRIVTKLRAQPMLVARLLADDLPIEVEAIFAAEGFCLFPGEKLGPSEYDVTTHCSCPDYANPCKHSSAVLILLGEWICRYPFGLLELRGFKIEEFCDEE